MDWAPLVLDDVHAQRAVREHCTPEAHEKPGQRVHRRFGAAGAPHAPFGWNTSLVKRTRGGLSG
jgi:hypothetical protein